jgi:epoxyqueuosine reductase
MNAQSLTIALKTEALCLGFELAGATPAVSLAEIGHLEQWLADGMAGGMEFFSRRMDAYRDPSRILPGVKSILMLGTNYHTVEPAATGLGQGRIARCAWGTDYHDVIRRRLRELTDYHNKLAPHGKARGVVDTAPLLERGFARQAGLGWIGKNTLLINEKFGSWIFLAALLTTEELSYDEPAAENRCRNCQACLDACPTGALKAPYQLDARKCISYLTIESREEIPLELRKACGNRLFGCDACQEACPWNRNTPISAEDNFQPRSGMNPINIDDLFKLNDEDFRHRFRDTPIWRIKLSGLLRNAAMVKNNQLIPGS